MSRIKPSQIQKYGWTITGSFTGSFIGDGSGLTNLPIPTIDTGSLVTTSSFNFYTGSNTSQFAGTSSYATSASYAVSASYEINYETSSSYAETASIAESASYASTSSYVTLSQTASYVETAQTASYIQNAQTASYISASNIDGTVTSASYALTASYALNVPQTASYANNANSASYSSTASYVENAQTASYVETAQTASYVELAQTASYVENAQTASYVETAQTASYISASNIDGTVLSSSHANNADSASYALTASYSETTQTASYAPNYLPLTGGTINGDVIVNGTASVAFLNVTYESASVIYSSGSNQLGDATNDIQTLIGTVLVSGSQSITGSLNVTNGITGSLQGTASYANQSLSSSYAVSASYSNTSTSASYATTASYVLNAVSSSYTTTSSYAQTASYVNPLVQNVIITGSIYIPDSTNSIYFSGSNAASRLVWNDIDGTLDLGLKGGNVTLQIGQETVIRVVNKTGVNLLESDFYAVRIRLVSEGGTSGQRLAVVLAQADSDSDSATTIGLVTENILVNQEGFICSNGHVHEIDTTGAKSYGGTETWSDGDILYLSPFHPGYLTNIKPQAPNHLIVIGYVEYAHAIHGKIFVKVDNGYELDELHNVKITTSSLSPGQLLVRSGSNTAGVWINSSQLTGSYGLTGSLTATSFTGSLFGTSSWASNALTASYVTLAQTASYVQTAQTASYVLNAVSSSYSTTASYVLNAVSASYSTTASYVQNAQTASYVVTAQTASYVQTAQTASYAVTSQTASYVTASNVIGTVTSSSYALSASYAPVSIPSGPWGISNSSGVYTYYTTLSASLAAASAGQVIEMFADITETGSITLKTDITIQGNGHTYTYSGNTGNVFSTPTGTGTYTFMNMNIKRANTATSTGVIFYGGSGFAATVNLKFIATTVTYTTTTGAAPFTANDSLCSILIDGINATGNSSGYLFSGALEYNIKNSTIENTGTGGCIASSNVTGGCSYENCYIKTNSGIGIFLQFASDSIRNCTGISSTGVAFQGQSGASAYDSFAFSNTNKAFNGLTCYNCTGQTTTGNAFYAGTGYNVTGKSTTGYTLRAFFTLAKYYNSSFYSSGTITVYDADYGVSLYNCSVITDYNNAAGHAISIGPSSGNPDFVNNFIQVANSSANCIKSTPATFSAKILKNTYKGATTPVNVNVVQLETNTQDNQGNIIL